jgi:RHS repeat-associated protein
MTYDGIGRMVSITELHGTTTITAKTFVWCNQYLCQTRDSTGHSVTNQFFTTGEQINGTNYYYTKDHLGNVREMTDSGGVVHASYDYDIFGRQTKISGDLDSDFGYTGFYVEKTICLDLTWFRAYDSEKGRWLSRDPMGEGIGPNLYNYVKNDVINIFDPLGLCGNPVQPQPFQNILPNSPPSPQPPTPEICKKLEEVGNHLVITIVGKLVGKKCEYLEAPPLVDMLLWGWVFMPNMQNVPGPQPTNTPSTQKAPTPNFTPSSCHL